MAGLKGKSLGGFRILEQIDEESGQGIVCKAICDVENPSVAVQKGQIVALKVMPVRDDGRRQQWRRLESRTKELVRISHPNVVCYYGCFCEQGEWNQLHVIVQEFLEGETLKNRLKRFPSGLDVDEGLKIVAFALEGLSHTASKGIVHRDIKPGNIFICENVLNGRKELSVKLIDFEVAKQGDGSSTASATASTGNLRGSFNYMAPEFLDKRFKGDLLSDVFSMGVTLHETLTGKLPYEQIDGSSEDALLDFVARWKGISDGKNPVSISPDVNRLLAHTDKLFFGCLSPTREQRFHSFEEFRGSLRNVRFRTLTNPTSGNAYQMLQFVGRGGFGEVFKARESKTGQVVAIKHLRKAKYADRFKREAKILSRLNDNCFVRFVESFSRDMDGKIQEFLVMGFLDGMPGNSLWDAIKKSNGDGLPKKDIFTAFIRYAHGLRMLHAAGIFHRDIKPSNLYFPAGRPELAAIMDLGIARDTKGTMTVGSVPGTPDYMPPEVVTVGSRGESGMDIYALGLCMYEALTAKSAFARLPSDIEGFRKLVERVNSKAQPRFDDGRIDADMFDLLTDMTAFNPEYRIKDVREVERRLREFLAKLSPDPVPVPSPVKKRWLISFAVVAGVGAFLYGTFSFVFPVAKKVYAEKRLANVLDSYRKLDSDASDNENAWIIEFNPQSYSWLRLEESMFVKCTNEINAVKGQVWAERNRKEWLDRIDHCLLHDGGLAVDAFRGLNALNLPADLDDDDQIRPKLSDLGHAVKGELGRCLSTDDIKSRRERLKTANEILANHWTIKVLDAGEMRRIKKSVDNATDMCVGSVHNGSGGEIEVCGVKIGVNETKTIAIKDGRPERQFVKRQGYKPIPLPTGFDGMDFNVDDSTFVIKPIKFSVPKLADGQRFFLRDHEYAGGESLELEPGRYIGKYVRNDKTSTGDKMYKDYFVEFSVTASADVKIPAPGNWEYTDVYKAFLSSPVDVEVPRLEDGVCCRIDSRDVMPGKVNVVPGRHLCIYEKDDCLAQTNFFEIMPGKNLVLPTPRDWKSTKDVERLRVATQLSEQKLWAKVEDAIQGIKVVAPENVKELDHLKNGVSAWKKEAAEQLEKERIAAAKQRAAEKKKLNATIAKLLEIEPVAGRRKRLATARDLLAGKAAQRILDRSEFESLRNDVQAATRLVVGRIRNNCDFDFSVNGIVIEPNESRVIKYNDGQSQGVIAKARGYEDRRIGKELDETEVVISKNQWTMADVLVRLGSLMDGVECLFNGERVKDDFKVKPGRYELLFKRNGYEPQVVEFVANISEGCTVEAPRKWDPLPVEVSLQELEDGVRCFLGHSEVVKTMRLTPGRSYEFRYQKDDCVDQRVKVFVEAGTTAVVPAPSFWVDTEDVNKLAEAERFFADGKLDEASRLLDGISLTAATNAKRLLALKGKIEKATEALKEKRERESAVKSFLEKAELAYTPEDLLGGSARDCIQGYFGAVTNGYVLNAEDRERIKHCYDVGLRDLKDQRKSVDGQIRSGVRPFRNPNDIDNDTHQLNEWYNALRK